MQSADVRAGLPALGHDLIEHPLSRFAVHADVRHHALEDVDEHGRRAGSFAGQRPPKTEFRGGHERRFYSERRSNSTRARPQSAAIWALSAPSDSNARSSRRRWTNASRIVCPYRSRSKSNPCVSIVVLPVSSTVGRVPMFVIDGRTMPSMRSEEHTSELQSR